MELDIHRIPQKIKDRSAESMFLHCEDGLGNKPESEADRFVINEIEDSLTDTYNQLFYKYPNIREGEGVKIDLVSVSGRDGVTIFEIRDHAIDDIDKIDGAEWTVSGKDTSQYELRAVRSSKESIERQLRLRDVLIQESEYGISESEDLKIDIKGYLALPNIESSEFHDKFELPDEVLNMILFEDDLEDRLISKLGSESEEPYADKTIRHTLAILKFSDLLSGSQLNVVKDPETKGQVARSISNRLKCLTNEQFEYGLQLPDDPQRIRGIAGSGKTVVVALRAAHAHYQTDWDICVTFRNHGLYQTHRQLINEFYDAFSGGGTPDWGDSIQLHHGWGGNRREGLYSVVVDKNDAKFITSSAATNLFNTGDPVKKLEGVCRRLLEDNDLDEQYDMIFIDEGQDLPPSFYQMCRDILSDEQRLYWAADEAQNLSSLEARDLSTLFGEDSSGNVDLKTDVKDFISGGISGTHIMYRSFRTPRSVLMAGHAFGMGLYRDEPVRKITDQDQWRRLGYEVEQGDFRIQNIGEPVKLKRPAEYSPHPLTQVEDFRDDSIYPLIESEWFDSPQEEYKWIASQIENDLEEGLKPEDIMIIFLWPPSDRDQKKRQLLDALDDVEGFDGISSSVNIVGKDDRSEFRKTGKTSLTQVHYARGNEAPMVYVTGLEYVSESGYRDYMSSNVNWHSKYIGARNEAFIAISRTLAWCRLTGSGEHDGAYEELSEIISDVDGQSPRLKFENPSRDGDDDDKGPMAVRQAQMGEY